MNRKRLLIIFDSNSIIHRAFHALPALTTRKGEKINAIYGFLLVFLKAIREFQPDYVIAVFDFPAKTFRHKEYKEYKVKRPPMAEDLVSQIPKIKEILKTFGVAIFEKEGFEADDIIGTLVFKKDNLETIIISGDLDTLQLINETTKVHHLKKGVKEMILYDEKMVREKYQGLTPKQLIDFKALRGDPSDNIPGVSGIGEKTAIKLIQEFGSLENLYENLFLVPEKIKIKLFQHKDQAFLSKKLAQIKKDVPINFDLENCQWKQYDKERAINVLKEFEFYSLINRLP